MFCLRHKYEIKTIGNDYYRMCKHCNKTYIFVRERLDLDRKTIPPHWKKVKTK